MEKGILLLQIRYQSRPGQLHFLRLVDGMPI